MTFTQCFDRPERYAEPSRFDTMPAQPSTAVRIDGEAVVLGPDGVSDFAALNSGKHNEQAQLYAFDMLTGDGEDHRRLPLSLRKAKLARLLSRQVAGIFLADYEQGDIGHDLFHAACRMALEGVVSKHRGRAYRGGRCGHWIKVKNRAHPAYSRVADLHWAARR